MILKFILKIDIIHIYFPVKSSPPSHWARRGRRTVVRCQEISRGDYAVWEIAVLHQKWWTERLSGGCF